MPPKEVSRDLKDAHPELAIRVKKVMDDFKAQTGRELYLTCVYRPLSEQYRLWLLGRVDSGGNILPREQWDRSKIVTNIDGKMLKGNHNRWPSLAVDVCVDIDPGPGKKATWDDAAYDPIGPLAFKHDLKWGGYWNGNLKDRPHLELPIGWDEKET